MATTIKTVEERAAHPVSLPVPNPTISLWQDPPSPLSNYRSKPDLPTHASVVIIGSGITGSTLAYELLSNENPSRHISSRANGTLHGDGNLPRHRKGEQGNIVMLEARTACSGATGRNGGHTKTASYRSFLGNVSNFGTAEAIKLLHFEFDCMRTVHQFAHEHKIQCDSWQGDTVDVFYSKKQFDIARDSISQIKEALGPDDPAARYSIWEAQDVEAKFGVLGSFGAVSYEAGSLSAYAFTTGLLSLALEKGLQLYTETPAIKLIERDGGWWIETTRGVIETEKVVLATNGYTAAIWPSFQGVIVPLRGQVTAQRRGSMMPSPEPPTTFSFIQEDGYEYMIQRPLNTRYQGDVVIGGGLTTGKERGLYEYGTVDDHTTDNEIMTYLTNSTTKYFDHNWGEDHRDGRIRRRWSGIMGYSADGCPYVGAVPNTKQLYIAGAFQGHGMVLCLLAARGLAAIMRGEEEAGVDHWLPAAFKISEERMVKQFRGRIAQLETQEKEMRHIG